MKTSWCAKVPLADGWFWCRYMGLVLGKRTQVQCPCRVYWIDERQWIVTTFRNTSYYSHSQNELKADKFRFGPRILEP